MLKIFICEDIQAQRERVRKVIENVMLMENLDMEIALATENPYELIDAIKDGSDVGMYFLDIDLKRDINGLKLAQEIRKYDPRGFIVFITTHSEMSYMTFIYKLEAMDFILKDDEEEMKKRVYQCLMNADERFASKANALQTNYTIKTGDKRITIDFNDIMFFETSANNHKVILHCTNRIIEYNARIKDIEKELDSRFYRCHRSFLVNKNNIKEIDIENRIAYMVNGEECLVSARQAKGLK